MALINWIVTLLVLFPTFVFLIHCPTVELVGVTVDYPNGYIDVHFPYNYPSVMNVFF